MRVSTLFAVSAASAAAVSSPTFPLKNAAVPGTNMPWLGLGTGAYSDNAAVGYGGYPECWSTSAGCGGFAQTAVSTWLSVGGRRIDSANSYQNQDDVGTALATAITNGVVARDELFILSKVGPSNPLGYNDTLAQFEGIKAALQTTYVDALLMHWPWDSKSQGNVTNNQTTSTDPLCNHANATYDEAGCRISTWRALVDIFNAGGARSIGVSNFNVSHLEEIKASGLPMPALTQNPFHLYRSATQMDIINYCLRNDIVFLGYSPFGVPDYKLYPTNTTLPVANQLNHPAVLAAAAAHGATPAQVLLAWSMQLGIPANPRSMNKQHMIDNLGALDAVTLTQAEMHALLAVPQDMCSFDATWCASWCIGNFFAY
jgi:alcohol dehydrogenase (NADP+)